MTSPRGSAGPRPTCDRRPATPVFAYVAQGLTTFLMSLVAIKPARGRPSRIDQGPRGSVRVAAGGAPPAYGIQHVER